MFFAQPARASFVEIAMTTGLLFLRCDFTAIVTGVSVIPNASFARVLAVQGATTSMSSSFFGPIGSAASMESIMS